MTISFHDASFRDSSRRGAKSVEIRERYIVRFYEDVSILWRGNVYRVRRLASSGVISIWKITRRAGGGTVRPNFIGRSDT